MVRFLQFIVDRTLSGDWEGLKEYVIGIEVFDKSPTFDPRMDSIVRVEARRLRHKLQAYYTRHGREDPVYIELRCGNYVPTFRRQHSRSAPTRNIHADTAEGDLRAGGAVLLQSEAQQLFIEIRRTLAAIEENWRAAQTELDRLEAKICHSGIHSSRAVSTKDLMELIEKAKALCNAYHATPRDSRQ